MSGANLSADWLEAKAALSMEDGKSYVVEFHGPPDTVIYALDVEGATEPDSAENALVHFNRDRNPRVEEAQEFSARARWTWWLRTDGGASRVVAAEI